MSDGRVTIDTRVDSAGAVKDINNLSSKVKAPLGRISALIAAAFSIKAVADFAKEATKLYETQLTQETKLATVMKQRMGANDEQIQSVKNLASAQQELGVIGDEVQLAGAQQVATFLNQKESLEKLMPAMNNLIAQQYGYNASAESAKNIGNLFGKVMQGQTTALKRVGISFSEAESNMLKYGNEEQRASVLAQVITNNVGNMNSALANTPLGQQVQLSNTIGDIKENFGQAFVNIKALFLPALNAVATIANKASLAFIGLSQALANTFGIDISNNKQLTESVSAQVEDASSLSGAMDDVSKNTKKANKQAKAGVRAFDELVNLSSGKDSGSGSSSGSVGGGASSGSVTVPKIDTKETTNLIDSLKTKLEDLKKAVSDIFGSSDVVNSVSRYVSTVKSSLSRIAKSAVSIGKTIGTNLINGFVGYFTKNNGFISDSITKIFDNKSDILNNIAELSEAFADIFTVFESPEAVSITSSVFGIIGNSILGVITLLTNFGKSLTNLWLKPIKDNAGKIKTTLSNLLKFVEPIMTTLSDAVTNTWTTIGDVYDQYVGPAFDEFASAISDIVSGFLDAFNTYIAPTLIEIGSQIQTLWTTNIQPVIDSAITLIGKIATLISAFWQNVLAPVAVWLMNKLAPIVSGVIKGIWSVVQAFVKNVTNFAKNVIQIISSIVDFLTNVFKGNWEGAWNSVKDIFSGIIDTIKGVIDGFVGTVKSIGTGISEIFNSAWTSITSTFGEQAVKDFFDGVWTNIQGAFSTVSSWFSTTFSDAWENVKKVFSTGGKVFSGIKDGILNGLKTVINKLIDGINTIVKVPFDALNTALKKLKDIDVLGVKPFGFLGEIKVPQIPSIPLATGAVLPPNKPFLATVGDQRHGTNVEAPLDTIVQAMNIALAKNGNSSGDIVINIDGNEIFRVIQNKANEYSKRTGLEAFA